MTTNVFRSIFILIIATIINLSISSQSIYAQCTVSISSGGTVGASSTVGIPGANINFYSVTPVSGNCSSCSIEYMWIIELNDSFYYYEYPSSADFSYTFTNAGFYKVYRCVRYVGCTNWTQESNHLYIKISSSCTPCIGNLIANPSFEDGTIGWSSSGGNLSAGGGGVHCGTYSGDFQITNSSSNWASQEIFPSNYTQGGQLNISVYAGTHDNTYNNYVYVDFFDANWNWISSSSQQVDKILAASPVGPQLYSWTATIPAGVAHISAGFAGTGSWTKTDDWCITHTNPNCTATINGLQITDTSGTPSAIVPITNGGTYYIGDLPSPFLLEALVTGSNYESVNFTLSGDASDTHTENMLPWNYPGTGGMWNWGTGNFSIEVKVFPMDNATGNSCANQNFNFIITNCDNITNAGSIGYDEIHCQSSFDPSMIQSIVLPSGGTGSIEYVWLITTDSNTVAGNASNYSTIPGANSSTYDPSTITQTTWYRRCSRRSGCSAFAGESNWVKKEIYSPASVGNFVWNDVDANGQFNEPASYGINGVTAQLWSTGNDNTINTIDDYLVSSTTTANNVSGNPGYYNFAICSTGNYFVKFPTGLSGNFVLTASNTAQATDNNSDADVRGNSGLIYIDVLSTGITKNNNTIDAGYFVLSKLGNYVWNDINKDGLQNNGEVGVAGISVSLYNANNDLVGTTVTDAYGYYLFENLYPDQYNVQVSLPVNYMATIQNNTDNGLNSDINPSTLKTNSYTITTNQFDSTIDAGIFFTTPPPVTKIGDRVWLDENKNGIQDATEPGISGVAVTLKDANGNVIASTITDANGNYIFENVPVGNGYTIFFNPLNQLVPTIANNTNDSEDSDIDVTTFSTPSFNVVAGLVDLTFDAGFYVQDNTKGSIGDRIWFDANQNGIQDVGEAGVGNIAVELHTASTAAIVAVTYTDEQGNYIFNNLVTPNVYYVVFNIPNGYSISSPNQGINDALDSDIPTTGTYQSPLVSLTRGESNLTIDAGVFTTNTASLGNYVWYDGNKNGIQDNDENGVSGVLVTLLDASGNFVDANASQAGIQPLTTNTDANGYYRFDNLTPNSYAVMFSNLPVGYSFTEANSTGAINNSNIGDENDSDVNPSTGKTTLVSLALAQYYSDLDAGIILGTSSGNGTIGDYVWNDINNNGLQEPQESGITGVTVALNKDLNNDGDFNDAGETGIQTTVTNSIGYYSFTDLMPGTYQVVFSNLPSGYVVSPLNQGSNSELDSDGGAIVSNTSTTSPIYLTIGQDDMSIDLGLYNPNVNSLGNYVWIDVNNNGLQDANEPGVAGIMATLLGADGAEYDANPGMAGVQCIVTTTNLQGLYMFHDLPNGVFGVKFSNIPQGFTFTSKDAGSDDELDSDVNILNYKTETVTLSSAKRINTSLDAGLISIKAALGNQVWNDKNSNGIQDAGEPGISGVTVTLYDATGANPITSMITDANGNYLFTNLEPSTYVVGFSTLPNNMEITLQDATNESLGNDNDASPASGKTLPVSLVAGEVNTNIDAGVKSSTPASVGNYVWLDANKNGIQDFSERGYPGVVVTLYNASNQPIGSTVTDGNGYYLFTNVTPANGYYISFTNVPQDVRFTTQTIGTVDGSDANINTGITPAFNLAPGENNNTIDAGLYKLTLKLGNFVWNDLNKDGIQDNNEPGVSTVTVGLYNASNSELLSTTVTDAYGYYYFDNILPGDYMLGFSLPVNYLFTLANVGNDGLDSDVLPNSNKTSTYTLNWGDDNQTIDAGIYLNTGNKASLGNRVWNDENKNGVQDTDESGFSGVVVTLFDQNMVQVASTITNGTGQYLFADLQPGTYAVRFTPPASYLLTAQNAAIDDENDSDADPDNGITGFYNLLAGENNMTVDAGVYFQQQNLASLGNYVWNDVNNNGLQDVLEQGVENVIVTLYGADGVTPIATTTTNSLGEYMFNGLVPAIYIVGFSNLPSGYLFSTSNAGTDDIKDSDPNNSTGKTNPIQLNAGEVNTTVDAGIYNPTASFANLGNYVWYDNDRDGLQHPDESGAAGITVELLDALNSNTLVMTTITDRYGYYMFNNIPAGTYHVRLANLPSGYEPTIPNQGANDEEDSDFEIASLTTSIPYTIGLGQTILSVDGGLYFNDLRFRNGSVGDFVWNDADNNGIQDIDELGVPGVTVTLYAADGTTIIATQITDGFGGYIFPNLAEGDYVIGFSNIPAGYTFSTPNQGTDDATDSDADPANSNKTPVFHLPYNGANFSLDAGIHQAIGLASLGNFVWNDLNQNGIQDINEPGVTGVVVNLFNGTNTQIASTTTDANGIYQFTGLIPGMYAVEFTNLPANFFITPKDAGTDDALDSDIDEVTNRTPYINLASGQNYPDFDGGIYTLKAGLGNYVWYDVNSNGLQDTTEIGVPGVTATLYNSSNVVVASTVTDALGRYQFVNLDPNTYYVVFSSFPSGYGLTSNNAGTNDELDSDADINGRTSNLTLTSGEFNPTVDAGLIATGTSSLGNYFWLDINRDGIQDPSEFGISGVTVRLTDCNDITLQSTVTNNDGSYIFNNLNPGCYKVAFENVPIYYNNDGNPMSVYYTQTDAGADNTKDNDADNLGKTGPVNIVLGVNDMTVDAGVFYSFTLPINAFVATSAQLGDNNLATINWYTENEKNIKTYEVWRSVDSKIFDYYVGYTESKGDNITKTFYNDIIKDDITSIINTSKEVYYKIRAIDNDGKSYYSNTVKMSIKKNSSNFMIFPSPFEDEINIKYDVLQGESVKVQIIDIEGRVVHNSIIPADPSIGILQLGNLGHLASGNYVIRITDIAASRTTDIKLLKK